MMRSNVVSGLAIPFSFPGLRRVRCLFSTIRSGDMMWRHAEGNQREDASARHRRFRQAAGFAKWADIWQVHGDRLVHATESSPTKEESPGEADGHYTCERNVALAIRTADCQPLMLARRDGGAVAALHVGWRGNARNFPGTAVERLCGLFSCDPRDLVAVRGPSLGPSAAEFVNFHDEWPPEFAPWFNPADKTVNLWALTRHQLERAGLRPEHIYGLDMCTHSMTDCFFSHRRKDAGRMVNVVWIAK